MNWKRWVFNIFILFVIAIINHKYRIIILPTENLTDYQFNFFTVTSALAGFSFTILGFLLGLGSEPLMNKLKDTNIVIVRCKKIVTSFVFFCISSIISLYFVVGGNNVITRILFNIFGKDYDIINQSIFLLEVLCVFAGLFYFMISIYSVYDLIKRVYGYKLKNYEDIKKNYKNTLNKAREYQNLSEEKIEKTDDFLEK